MGPRKRALQSQAMLGFAANSVNEFRAIPRGMQNAAKAFWRPVAHDRAVNNYRKELTCARRD